jgi:hypothetical protein
VESSGEEGGSFFTIIFGVMPFRDALGEAFAGVVPFGLPEPLRCAATFGVAEAEAGVGRAGGDCEAFFDGAMSM